MYEGKRSILHIMAKFHIDPNIQGQTLRKLEQVIIDVVGEPKKDLSNVINALNKAKREAMVGVRTICRK